ncbi:MAG: O-antigen ligase family protein [Rubripirellula sp.]|nr:O-antigen ligase family protein [Rubripirellula sp.]
MTYFLSPHLWWWGDLIEAYRVNLFSALLLLVVSFRVPSPTLSGRYKTWLCVGCLIFANMTIVHLLFGDAGGASYNAYIAELKFLLFTYLFVRVVRTTGDLQVVVLAIVLGAGYLGYECIINERGEIEANRLEGVGAPGATTANHFASLLVSILPLVTPLLLAGRIPYKLAAIISATLILDVVLLCNSRGAFLAAIMSVFVFIFCAPKGLRGIAYRYLAAGLVVLFLLMGDTRIIDRFMTSFAGSEERDDSAQSRIEFWMCGIEMLKDYPLGAGGNAFKKTHGHKYLGSLNTDQQARSLHNGFLQDATSWGIQGLFLRLLWFYYAIRMAYDARRQKMRESGKFLFVTQLGVLTGLAAFLGTAMFTSVFDAEWGFWLVALAVCSALIYEYENNDNEASMPAPVEHLSFVAQPSTLPH